MLTRSWRMGLPRSDGEDPINYSEDIARVLKDSGKALWVETVTGVRFWVPQSVIHEDSDVYKMGTSGKLIVHQWFADKEKWK